MKLQSYATLKRKMDKVFSEYVRRRHADADGTVACVCCGNRKHWKKMQAGHFVTRTRMTTRWDLENCAPQCGKCNVLLRGNAVGYAHYLVNRYGQDIFARLRDKSALVVKYSRRELRALIEECETRAKAIGA